MSKCFSVCIGVFFGGLGVGSLVTLLFIVAESFVRVELMRLWGVFLQFLGSLGFGPFGVFQTLFLGCSDFFLFGVPSNLLLDARCTFCRILIKKFAYKKTILMEIW